MTPSRFWRNACCLGIAVLLPIAVLLTVLDWNGRISLPDGAVGWLMVAILALLSVAQMVDRPQAISVRSDKELEGLKRDVQAIRTGMESLVAKLTNEARDRSAAKLAKSRTDWTEEVSDFLAGREDQD